MQQDLAEVSSYNICHLYLAASLSPVSCAIGHGCWWCAALLVLWPFTGPICLSERGRSSEVPSPPARLILHASAISSIDHGCRRVCRCLHRSVSLITHPYSSARLLISPRPLSLLHPSSSPLSCPLAFSFHCSLSFALTHIFLIRQKSKTKYEYS